MIKICSNCAEFHECPGCHHGWCAAMEDFVNGNVDAEDCEDYIGCGATPPTKTNYQSEIERDNPRDPVVER